MGGRLHLRADRAGTAYTAFVIDAFARLITGWRTAASHSTDLVLDALVMAVTCRARQGVKVAGLIHRSDAGSEYLSIRYGAELAAAGIAPSVGSVGESYDNALAESIIGLYKTEVIDHLGPWETPAQVEAATSEWASWYNTARVMRRTGGRPPAEYEQAWRDGTLGQVPARGPGSRPRRKDEGGGHGRRSLPRRAPPAPARAPPRTPALLRDGPAGQDGCGGGRASPRRPRDGCHGTPAQVKGASGAADDDAARHPCPARGTRGAQAGARRGDARAPAGAWRAEPAARRGNWTAQLDRCSIKQKRKNDQTVVPPGGGTVEDDGHPDQSIWGESSLHQTRGAPRRQYGVEVIWAGLLAAARGRPWNQVAAELGVPYTTVREWLRRFTRRADRVHAWLCGLLPRLVDDPVWPAGTRGAAGDVLAVLGALHQQMPGRWPLVAGLSPGQLAARLSRCGLLAPSWPPGAVNTSSPVT